MNREESNSPGGPQPWGWLVGPDAQTWALKSERVSCGRARDNDLVLDDPSISRRHAQFERRTEGYVLVDLGSANGTRVNDEIVSAASPRLLRDGDRLTIGHFLVTFRLQPAPAVSHTAPPGRAGIPRAQEHHTDQMFVALPEIVTRGKLVYAKIRAQGVLNSETIEQLLEACQWAIAQNVTRILIDTAGLDYVDSAGISGLVRLQRQLKQLGGGAGIAAPPPSVREILELTNLSGFLPMFRDESEAVAAVRSSVS